MRVVDVGGQRGEQVGDPVAAQPRLGARGVGGGGHPGHERAGRVLAAGVHPAPQRPAHHGEHDVVERDAGVGHPHLLQLGERQRAGGVGAPRRQRPVERRPRRVQHRHRHVGPLGPPVAHHRRDPGDRAPHQPRDQGDLEGRVDQSRPDQRRPGRHVTGGRARGRRVLERVLDLGVAVGVDDVAEQRVGGHAVGQRVVHLADDRRTAALEPAAQVQLPQRVVAVERGAGDLADQPLQVGHRAGAPDLVVAEVVVAVDRALGHPDRVVEPQRHRHHASPQRRQLAEPGVDAVAEPVEGEPRVGLEHRDLQGVHVHGGRLHVEEAGVGAVHPLHAAHRWPTRAPGSDASGPARPGRPASGAAPRRPPRRRRGRARTRPRRRSARAPGC